MPWELKKSIEARRRIYLVRHADVSYFDGSGRPLPVAGVSLSREGIGQAEAAREALRGIPFDRAVDSGLPRTRETATIILGGQEVPRESREELREVAPGRLMDPRAPDFEARFVGALGEGVGRDTPFLAGETFGSLEDRALPAFRALVQSGGWKELLIVAHGGTNRILLLHALGAGLPSLSRLEQDAGCINILDVSPDGGLLVRLVNFTPYAPLKEGLRATTMEKIYLEHRRAFEGE